MRNLFKTLMDTKRWLPIAIAFVIGLSLAFLGNLLFGTELEIIGLVVAMVLLILYLGVLALIFYVLHMVQRRARWDNENFQIALKAKLELDREVQMAKSSRERQMLTAELDAKRRSIIPSNS